MDFCEKSSYKSEFLGKREYKQFTGNIKVQVDSLKSSVTFLGAFFGSIEVEKDTAASFSFLFLFFRQISCIYNETIRRSIFCAIFACFFHPGDYSIQLSSF